MTKEEIKRDAKTFYKNLGDLGNEASFIDGVNFALDKVITQDSRLTHGKYEKFRDFILDKEKENKIVIFTGTNEMVEVNIDEFIKQPVDGILYDLNRNKTTILTFIEDKKWVNDYALSLIVKKLYSKL